MTFLATSVRDNGLGDVPGRAGLELHITSSEPTTRTAALNASLGQKIGPTINGPTAGTGNERLLTIPAITDGSIDTTGDWTHWALIDDTELIAAEAIVGGPISVTSGNIWKTTEDIIISMPAAVTAA